MPTLYPETAGDQKENLRKRLLFLQPEMPEGIPGTNPFIRDRAKLAKKPDRPFSLGPAQRPKNTAFLNEKYGFSPITPPIRV